MYLLKKDICLTISGALTVAGVIICYSLNVVSGLMGGTDFFNISRLSNVYLRFVSPVKAKILFFHMSLDLKG